MYRATTPTHTFSFTNLNPEDFKKLNVYYAQQGIEILSKEKNDFVFKAQETEQGILYLASVVLTQDETKLFKPRQDVEVQLRVLTSDNRSLASQKYRIPVNDVINDEVLE